jgi:hypothetical protein
MDSVKNQKSKKKKVVIVLTILMLLAVGIYLCLTSSRKDQNKNNKVNDKQLSQIKTEKTKIKTFKSKHTNITFQYPSNWTLKETDAIIPGVVLTNENGRELDFYENFEGGLGGFCRDYSQDNKVLTFKKLAKTGVDNVNVFEVKDEKGGVEIGLSRAVSDDGKHNYCDIQYYFILSSLYDYLGPLVTGIKSKTGQELVYAYFMFGSQNDDLSAKEKAEMVEILSSFRLE